MPVKSLVAPTCLCKVSLVLPPTVYPGPFHGTGRALFCFRALTGSSFCLEGSCLPSPTSFFLSFCTQPNCHFFRVTLSYSLVYTLLARLRTLTAIVILHFSEYSLMNAPLFCTVSSMSIAVIGSVASAWSALGMQEMSVFTFKCIKMNHAVGCSVFLLSCISLV